MEYSWLDTHSMLFTLAVLVCTMMYAKLQSFRWKFNATSMNEILIHYVITITYAVKSFQTKLKVI